jgi:hypothetical protein
VIGNKRGNSVEAETVDDVGKIGETATENSWDTVKGNKSGNWKEADTAFGTDLKVKGKSARNPLLKIE